MKFKYFKATESIDEDGIKEVFPLFDIRFYKGKIKTTKRLKFDGFFYKYMMLEFTLLRHKWVLDLEYGHGYNADFIRKR